MNGKKILVISDTHGDLKNLKKLLSRERKFDTVIHLGDTEGTDREIRALVSSVNPLSDVLFVRGNCDQDSAEPYEKVYDYEGVRIFFTHGNRYQVKSGFSLLTQAAGREGCQTALYGHTHIPFIGKEEGILIANPGSLKYPRQTGEAASYGVIRIFRKGVLTFEHRYLVTAKKEAES